MTAWNEMYASITPRARVGFLVAAITVLVLAVAAGYWALRQPYEVLFANLEPRDAAGIVSELERLKVPHRLEFGGANILVPAQDVHQVRLKLTGSGIPLHGGVGFEIFDGSDFGMTDFAQKINFQRALQGELSRTISSIQEVKHARVHLVMEDGGLFKQNKRAPTASVTLFMNKGASLGPERITGIQGLVAASVPGLDTNGVTVLDQRGVTLTRVVSDEALAHGGGARLQKKQEVEEYLLGKVRSALEAAFPGDRIVASIDVALNFDQVKTTREDVIPHTGSEGIIRKRETRNSGTRDKASPENSISEVEYHLGRKVDQIVVAPGGIERLSVGVLVPETFGAERLLKVRQLVSMAIGVDLERGDAVAVEAVDFGQAATPQETETPSDLFVPDLRPIEETQGSASEIVRPEIGPSVSSPLSSLYAQVSSWEPGRVVIVLGFALLVLLGVAALYRRKARSGRPLSAPEREELLVQLKDWLGAEEEFTAEAPPR